MEVNDNLLWSDEFSTHIRAIDNDHKELFDIFGTLHAYDLKHKSTEQIENVLALLSNYIHYHFEREERFMESAGYPDINEHKQLHEILKHDVQGLRSLFTTSPEEVKITRAVAFLFKWLQKHILKEDMKYVPYMRGEKNVQKSAQEKADTCIKISVCVPRAKAALIENCIEVILEHGLTGELEQLMNELQKKKLKRARFLFT